MSWPAGGAGERTPPAGHESRPQAPAADIVVGVDEGLPIAYVVLERGVPVVGSDGAQVGTVDHVVAAPEEDIFHGIVIATGGHGRRFIEAADIAALHERGVDLRIDAAAAQNLPEPGGAAPVFAEDPGEMKGWRHWVNVARGRGDWKREG